ncbi:MAG: glutathione S-transferase [Ahrensia sp.]|nr:glutathione S-transferase [Ahrensia sp.]
MITLHHLRIGRSIWTVFLLEELGIDYTLKIYERDPKTNRAQADLKAATPLGKSPVLEDGDIVLSESGAITSYLIENCDPDGRLGPPETDKAARADWAQWLHYSEGSLFGPLLMKMVLTRTRSDAPLAHGYADAEIALHLDHVTAKLGDAAHILGDAIQGPDFGLGAPLQLAKGLGLLEGRPALLAYLDRMQTSDAFKRAVEKSGG